jgi:tetratricopeptide (TPR) repeat protein
MDLPTDFKAALVEARNLHREGRLLEAERIYRSLATPGAHRCIALEALADLFLLQRRMGESLQTLNSLTEEDPDNLNYCAKLANLLDSLGRTQEGIEEYMRLLQRQPGLAIAHFNVARLYGKEKQYSDAIASYENAIRLNIDQVEEIYSNLGIMYSETQEADKARKMYERALEVAPDYIPALYNLAGHFEETDEKQQAIELYERILSINPRHWDSLARLAYPRKITSEHQDLINRLEMAVEEEKEDNMKRERLYFALGKAFDDLKMYDKASAAYVSANEIGKLRAVPYNGLATERAFDRLIEWFDAEWISQNATSSTATPIFICGMFRSGSTLLEQMLGAHPSVTAGGEFEILPWLIGSELAPYPQGIKDASGEQLQRVGEEYLSRVRDLFPEHERITDKRPDNFLHLGLIKVLFPAAKIIHTRRSLLDNCLSLYFQQLGNNFSYATDVENSAHYHQQQQRLMAHWISCLGDEIFAVDYEELVASPEPVMRRLLDYLGLEWDARVLEFQKAGNFVKTPSLWQVREKLHTRSSGRWQNYETLVQNLR